MTALDWEREFHRTHDVLALALAHIEVLEKIAADKVALNEHCAVLEIRIERLENYICNCGKPNGAHSGWCRVNEALRSEEER